MPASTRKAARAGLSLGPCPQMPTWRCASCARSMTSRSSAFTAGSSSSNSACNSSLSRSTPRVSCVRSLLSDGEAVEARREFVRDRTRMAHQISRLARPRLIGIVGPPWLVAKLTRGAANRMHQPSTLFGGQPVAAANAKAPYALHAADARRQFRAEEPGVGSFIRDSSDGGESQIDRGRSIAELFEVDSIAQDDGPIEGQPRLRVVPGDEFPDGVLVRALTAGGGQTVQHGGFRVFEVGKRRTCFEFFLPRSGSVLPWTLLIVALFVARNTLDALVPTHDFHVRAAITTLAAATIWFTAGFLTAWRTRMVQSAAVTGALTAVIAPAVTISLTLLLMAGLALTDSRDALAAIDRAGGVGEMFVLPLLVFLPATALAVLGGLAAAVIRRVAS